MRALHVPAARVWRELSVPEWPRAVRVPADWERVSGPPPPTHLRLGAVVLGARASCAPTGGHADVRREWTVEASGERWTLRLAPHEGALALHVARGSDAPVASFVAAPSAFAGCWTSIGRPVVESLLGAAPPDGIARAARGK